MSEHQEFTHLNLNKTAPRSTINVHLRESVDVDVISKIVATIGNYYGCRACGLLGIDLRLTGDPVEFKELANLPGVRSISAE